MREPDYDISPQVTDMNVSQAFCDHRESIEIVLAGLTQQLKDIRKQLESEQQEC